MSRSLKKEPFIEQRLFNRVKAAIAAGEKKVIKTWSRSSTIYPEFIGYTISVYNGKKHVPVYCTTDMVGYKLGDFVPTRNFKAHKAADKKVAANKK